MKGLILSGGKGSRLRPFTYTRAKQLLPLANKPVLFYAIESLIEAGITDIGIIVGDTHEEIEAEVGDGSRWGKEISITFIQQVAPLGLAHAVLTAKDFLGDSRFVLFLGDNLIGESIAPLIQEFGDPHCEHHSQILLTPVENPSAFGIVELAEENTTDRSGNVPLRVKRLVEKPLVPQSNLALVGIYCFDHHIIEAASSIQPSKRGELELTDAIQWMVDQGYDVRPQILKSYWIDTGKMADILSANRVVLSTIKPDIDPTANINENCTIQGDVTIQAGASISNSIIRGPVIIGERSVIRDAYIGPFTSIYHDVVVDTSEIEYSIVLEHSTISHVQGRIEESLLGRHAEVESTQVIPRSHKLTLGDHSRVEIVEK